MPTPNTRAVQESETDLDVSPKVESLAKIHIKLPPLKSEILGFEGWLAQWLCCIVELINFPHLEKISKQKLCYASVKGKIVFFGIVLLHFR